MQRSERIETNVSSQFLQALNEQGLRLTPDGLYAIQHKPGVATLIDPINGAPYVVTFGHDDKRAHVTLFEPEPGSGTDKLRCRLAAEQFYLSIQPQRVNQ